jgi:ESS family glutamate:Na+ symporter
MLNLFLGMALISLKIWQLFELALPLIVLAAVQTIFMILFVRFVTFPFLGRDYDAAVMSSGIFGFGMGATPVALSNMQAVTLNRPLSHTAFLVIPIVGGMFLDIINSFTILFFLNMI